MISRGEKRRREVLHEARSLSHRLVELSDELTEFTVALAEFNKKRSSEDDKGADGDA